jgi:hypothetical protein
MLSLLTNHNKKIKNHKIMLLIKNLLRKKILNFNLKIKKKVFLTKMKRNHNNNFLQIKIDMLKYEFTF